MDTKTYSAPLCEVRKLLARRGILADCGSVLHPADGYENGHAYVDLGLPSGLEWATMNVGASNVTEYGEYYAYGETKPQSNNRYDWNSYKWCNGTCESLTKYCTSSDNGTVDNKTHLVPGDDAAVQNWGGAWRMPTRAEQEELVSNCYWVWTSNYNGSGIAGYIVYAAKSSADKGHVITSGKTPSSEYSLSDSHIFLPAAGCRDESSLKNVGEFGCYWSSSLEEECDYDDRCAPVSILFHPNYDKYLVDGGNNSRTSGLSIRAVCEL